jgi:hypothetical protein
MLIEDLQIMLVLISVAVMHCSMIGRRGMHIGYWESQMERDH